MARLKIVSLNTRGLRDNNKRREVYKVLRDKKADIAMLQETRTRSDTNKLWQNEWGPKMHTSDDETNARGVAILLHRNLDITVHKVKKEANDRLLIVDFTCDKNRMLLCNIYAPNTD